MSVREDRRLKLVYRLMGGPFREGGMTEQTVYRSEADTGEWRERSTRRKTGATWREGYFPQCCTCQCNGEDQVAIEYGTEIMSFTITYKDKRTQRKYVSLLKDDNCEAEFI